MSAFPIGSYVAPKHGQLANLPMKIKSSDKHGWYNLEHPTTHRVYGYEKAKLRICNRKEIEQIRILK